MLVKYSYYFTLFYCVGYVVRRKIPYVNVELMSRAFACDELSDRLSFHSLSLSLSLLFTLYSLSLADRRSSSLHLLQRDAAKENSLVRWRAAQ